MGIAGSIPTYIAASDFWISILVLVRTVSSVVNFPVPLTLTHVALFGVLLHVASLQSLALEKA